MENQMKFEGQIECISILRVIGALGIALYHIGTFNNYIATPQAGVSMFFCISAFLMMYTTQKGVPKHYILKRLIRIVPLYWIMTVFTFAAMQIIPSISTGGTPEFVKSLFFIPYVRHALKSADVVRPMVGPGWTLFYDVYFTFIFDVCMKLSHKFRGVLAIVACTMLLMIQYKFQPEHPFLFVLSQPWWISFVVGIGAFYVLRYIWDKKTAVNIKIIFGASAAVALAFMFLSDLNIYRNAILSGITLISLILVFRKQAMFRTINFLGKISFSFYMIHYYVILVVGRVIDLKVVSVKSMCAIVFILLSSIVLAGIANYLIEDKFTHFLKEKLCRE